VSGLTDPNKRTLVFNDSDPIEMLTISQLSKEYDGREVLRNASFGAAAGEITALMGHNGSGKTTILKIILGLVRQTLGTISYDGEIVSQTTSFRSRVGYMPQHASFPDQLRVREVVALLKDLRPDCRETDLELWQSFELNRVADSRIHTLSGGTIQKVSAFLATMFRPDLLILDEPTASLDPVSASILKSKIRRMRDAGSIVLLSSHIVTEVESLCDSLVLLNEGRIVFTGPAALLRAVTNTDSLEQAITERVRGAVAGQSDETEMHSRATLWAPSLQ